MVTLSLSAAQNSVMLLTGQLQSSTTLVEGFLKGCLEVRTLTLGPEDDYWGVEHGESSGQAIWAGEQQSTLEEVGSQVSSCGLGVPASVASVPLTLPQCCKVFGEVSPEHSSPSEQNADSGFPAWAPSPD